MVTTKYLTVPHLDTTYLVSFFSKVYIDDFTGCWFWSGSRDKFGYGHVRYGGGLELTHRLMWVWLIGPLPKGRRADIPVLDHIVCDRPSCCNPCHLRLVLNDVNIERSNAFSMVTLCTG